MGVLAFTILGEYGGKTRRGTFLSDKACVAEKNIVSL